MAESFTFKAPPGLHGQAPLRMTAKRYIDGRQSKDGLTVLLAHGTGTRESHRGPSYTVAHRRADMQDRGHWEPMLRNLFEVQSTKNAPRRIREAWAFDWHTHGDSAVLDSNALKTRPDSVCEITL
jgi:hypothetical protein